MPNQFLSLKEFSRGIVLAMDQTDLPLSALKILENLDGRVPGKLALLFEDAMIGSDRWDEVHAEHDDGYNAPGAGYTDSATVPGPIPGDPPSGSESNAYAQNILDWQWHLKLVDPGVGQWIRHNPGGGSWFSYLLLDTHIAVADTEPEVGADSDLYWRGPFPDDGTLGNWALTTTYTVPSNSSLLGFPSYPRRYGLLRQDDTRFVWTLSRFREYSISNEEYRDALYVREIGSTAEPYAFFWHADRTSPADPSYGFIDLNQNPVEAHNKLLIQLTSGDPVYMHTGNQAIFWQVPKHDFHKHFWLNTDAVRQVSITPDFNGEFYIPGSGLPVWFNQYEIFPKWRTIPPGDDDAGIWDPLIENIGPSWAHFMGAEAKSAMGVSLGLSGLAEYDAAHNPSDYTHFPLAIRHGSVAHDSIIRWNGTTSQFEGSLVDYLALASGLAADMTCSIAFAYRRYNNGVIGPPEQFTRSILITGGPERIIEDEVDSTTGYTVDYYKLPFTFVDEAFVSSPADVRHGPSDLYHFFDLALTNSFVRPNPFSWWGNMKFEIVGTPISFEIRGAQQFTQARRVNWLECPPGSVSVIQQTNVLAGKEEVKNALMYPDSETLELVGADAAFATVLTEASIVSTGNKVPVIGLRAEGSFEADKYAPWIHALFIREDAPEGGEYGDSSAFSKNPLWQSSGIASYYLVAEWEWGGFSAAFLLRSGPIDTVANGVSMSVAIQTFHLMHSDHYMPDVRRWHVFRKFKPLSGEQVETDTWLFAVDPRDGVFMSAEYVIQSDTVGLYVDQGSREGFELVSEGENPLELIGESFWYNLAPGLLASFVDYGQDPAAETAETITGIKLDDLIEMADTNHLLRPREMQMKSIASNRLWFARGDEVDRAYYSEVGRYNLVAADNYVEIPGAGRFVGASTFHQYIMLFFRDMTVVVDARSGIDLGWQKVFEFAGAGAQTMDTVAKFERGVLWAGSGAVWLWNGASAEPERISPAIEYPGFDEDMFVGDDPGTGYPKAWGAFDPEHDEYLLYIPYMPGATTTDYGTFLFDTLEALVPGGTLFGMKPRLLVWSAQTGAWRTESVRAFLNLMPTGPWSFFDTPGDRKENCDLWRVAPPYFANIPTAVEPYKYTASLSRAIRPIVLDNRMLIPVGSARSGASAAGGTFNHWLCPYLAIRQGVQDFISDAFWVHPDYNQSSDDLEMDYWPIFKHGILETGLLDMQQPGTDKRLRKLIASFGGNRVGRQLSGMGDVDKTGPWKMTIYGFRAGSFIPSPYEEAGANQAPDRILVVNFDESYSSDVTVDDLEFYHEIYVGGDPCRYFLVKIEAGSLLKTTGPPFGGNRFATPPFRDFEAVGLSYMARRQK